jgi:glyoxylase-like metal-dependent hydrolase (beta-lactamase superfamily II)
LHRAAGRGNGEFFSADAIYDDELYDQLEDSSIVDYLATMRRLLELDISIGHGGHGPSFDGERMREIALDYIRTREG